MEASQSNNGNTAVRPVILVCLVSVPAEAQGLWGGLQEAMSAAVSSLTTGPRMLEASPVATEAEDEWRNHPEAAAYLGCSESTLYKYASQGKIECRKYMGRLQYRLSVLEQFKNAQMRTPRASPGRGSRGKMPAALGSGK